MAYIQRPKTGVLSQLAKKKLKTNKKLGTLIIPVTTGQHNNSSGERPAELPKPTSFIQLDVSLKNVNLFPEQKVVKMKRLSNQGSNPYMQTKSQFRIFKTKKYSTLSQANSLKNISPYKVNQYKQLQDLNYKFYPETNVSVPQRNFRSASTMNINHNRIKSQQFHKKITDRQFIQSASSFMRHQSYAKSHVELPISQRAALKSQNQPHRTATIFNNYHIEENHPQPNRDFITKNRIQSAVPTGLMAPISIKEDLQSNPSHQVIVKKAAPAIQPKVTIQQKLIHIPSSYQNSPSNTLYKP